MPAVISFCINGFVYLPQYLKNRINLSPHFNFLKIARYFSYEYFVLLKSQHFISHPKTAATAQGR